MFKRMFSKKCAWCIKPHANNRVSTLEQSRVLQQRLRERNGIWFFGDLYLCNPCFEMEKIRKQQQEQKNEQQELLNRQEQYVCKLRSLVEVAELEAKAVALGINTNAIKSEFKIGEIDIEQK